MEKKITSKSLRIKIAMLRKGIKQVDIARELNLKRQDVYGVIVGKRQNKEVKDYIKIHLGIEV